MPLKTKLAMLPSSIDHGASMIPFDWILEGAFAGENIYFLREPTCSIFVIILLAEVLRITSHVLLYEKLKNTLAVRSKKIIEAHIGKLCVMFRSRVLLGVCLH